MRFAFIRDHQAEFPVGLLCEVLGVSRSGYYAWRDRPPSPRAVRRERLAEQIRQVHEEARSVYGSPRVHRELEARGVACCENTVAELMREHGIRSKAGRRFVPRTTESRHDRPVAENVLAREFYPTASAYQCRWRVRTSVRNSVFIIQRIILPRRLSLTG